MPKSVNELKNELNRLYAHHVCHVTPEMLEEERNFRKHLKIIAATTGYSYAIFNLKEGCLSFQLNDFSNLLPQNSKMNSIDELTHPEDMAFVLELRIAAYLYLLDLPIERRPESLLIYLRRIMKRNGGFQLILQRVSVCLFDEEGNPWQILVESELLPRTFQPENTGFRIYTICPEIQGISIQSPIHPCAKLLTKREKEILLHSNTDQSAETVGEKLFISPFTVKSHYTNIRKKLNSNSVKMAGYLAYRMDIVKFEENGNPFEMINLKAI